MHDGIFCLRHADYTGFWRGGFFAVDRIMKDKTFEISLQKHIQKMTTDFQQDGEFSPTATGRADRSELVAAISQKLNGIAEDVIMKVLDALPGCMAAIMLEAGKDEQGHYHFAGKDLFSAKLTHHEAAQGHGVADGHDIPEHYALHLKPSEGMERIFSGFFPIPITG